MNDGRIQKDLLYVKLATVKRPTGRPQLRFKDICKPNLHVLDINTYSWEVTATHSLEVAATYRDAWRHTVKLGLSQYEETQRVKAEEKRLHKKTVCVASRPCTV